jgi:hypothetical protein
MKQLLLIIITSLIGHIGFGQLLDSKMPAYKVPLTMNTHVDSTNYLSWSALVYKRGGLFVIERRDCNSSEFEVAGLLERPSVPNNALKVGFWWNEVAEKGCEYRVFMYDDPEAWVLPMNKSLSQGNKED